MFRLTEKQFVDFIANSAETGMGYVVVTALLKDGRKFEQVVVVGLNVSMVREYAEVPFTESDVDHFVVTHDKWDWSYT